MKYFFFILYLFSSFAHSEVQKLELKPGALKIIEWKMSEKVFKFTCDKKEIPFSFEQNILKSFISVSYFSGPHDFSCFAQTEKGKIELYQVKVIPYKYKEEKLKVAPKMVNLSKKDFERYLKEKEKLTKIYENFSPNFLFNDKFMKPSTLPISSSYGTKRVFNKQKKTQHLGVDFRAPEGTEVLASNRGKIVFAGDLYFSGNTILIDHGLSLFTMYAHLSKITCKEGDVVERGVVLGLSGKTGRVSGPHLHWGVKADGSWVDGFTLPLN